MGIYYIYVCCDSEGRVVAQFNPQRGFGGLKWGEFVGTPAGREMLSILKKQFCPRECVWGIVSDAGYVSKEIKVGCDDYDVYDAASEVPDFALNEDVRKIALSNNYTSQILMDVLDNTTQLVSKMFNTTPKVAYLDDL